MKGELSVKRKLKKKYVAILSVYALFFISYFSLITLAKYTNLLNRNGNVSVAKWDVALLGENNKTLPTMVIGNSSTYQDYTFTVTSTSEVGINYSVIISNVPEGVEIQVDDSDIYNEDNNKITITNLGSFSSKDTNTTHTHKLSFILPIGIDAITNQELDIDVIFTQNQL